MYKKGLKSIILYFLSFILIILLSIMLAQRLFGNIIGMDTWLILFLGLFMLPMFFFYIPSIPWSYEFQFKGKIKPDIPKDELEVLILESTRKSLELASVIIIVMCVLSILVYSAAKYLAISDIITLVLVVATAFNTFLISMVVVSLGGYNKDLLRTTFTEEEYKRYTRLSNYKRIFTLLVIFDVLIVILLLYSILGKLTIGLAIILLVAIFDNVILAIGLWNYMEMKSKSESERKALIPQMKISLAMLVVVDLIFIVSFIIQKIWIGASYEKTVFVVFAIFFLVTGILGLLWFILTSARRILRSRQL